MLTTGTGLGLALVVLLLHLARLDALALPALPILWALVLPIRGTLAWRLLVAVPAVVSSNAVVAFLAGLVGLPYDTPVAVTANLLPLAAMVGAGLVRVQVGRIADFGDLLAIGAGLVVLFLVMAPALGLDDGHLLAVVVGGEDNAAHLAIVNAIGTEPRYPFFAAEALRGRILDGYITYPAGFHLSVALVLSAVANTFGPGGSPDLVRVFFVAAAGVQALWAATTVMAVRSLAGARRSSLAGIAVVAGAMVLLFAFGPPGATVRFGFQPQASALWLLTAGLVAGTSEALDGKPLVRLVLVVLAAVGTAWCWYLVVPVMGFLVIGVVIAERGAYRLQPGWVGLIAGGGLIAALPPIWLSVEAGAATAINARGGVYSFDPLFLALLVLGGVGPYAALRLFPNTRGRLVALVTFGSSLAFSAILLGYQLKTAGAAGYFFQKSLYTLFMLAAVCAGVVLLAGLTDHFAKVGARAPRQVGTAAFALLLAWTVTGLVTPANPGRLYLAGNARHIDPAEMSRLLADGSGSTAPELVWNSAPDPIYDYYASRIAAALSLRESRARFDLIVGNVFAQDPGSLLGFVRVSPDGVRIVTRDPDLAVRLRQGGFDAADLDRLDIEVVHGALDNGPSRHGTDIALRSLLTRLFGRHRGAGA